MAAPIVSAIAVNPGDNGASEAMKGGYGGHAGIHRCTRFRAVIDGEARVWWGVSTT